MLVFLTLCVGGLMANYQDGLHFLVCIGAPKDQFILIELQTRLSAISDSGARPLHK